MVARLWLSRVRFFRLSGYLVLRFRRRLDPVTRVPANVPRELTGGQGQSPQYVVDKCPRPQDVAPLVQPMAKMFL